MSLRRIIDRWVDAYFRFHPEEATAKGWHVYDARPPSFGPRAVARFRRELVAARAAVDGLDPGPLRSDDAVDLAVLKAHLSAATLHLELGWLETNPRAYVEPALDALHDLELAHYLPAARRRRALARRLDGLGGVLDEVRGQVVRPMSPHVEAAREMLEATAEDLGARYPEARVGRAVAAAAERARRAVDRALTWCARCDAAPFEPMGEARYARLLADVHLLEGGVDGLLTLGHRTLGEVERALAALPPRRARAEAEPPAGFGWKDVLGYYRGELEAVRAFVAERALVTLPRAEVVLQETPAYLAGLAPRVFYQPPPAFSRSRRGHLFVARLPRQPSDETRRELWGRVHGRRFRNTLAHEVWPGHHLQLVRAAESPRPIRKYRDDDVMVEGWALYAEALVREHGLWREGEDEARRPLMALRFRAARVVVDASIHTGRLSLGEAVEWLCERFGERNRPWLEREVRRYAGEPGQAMSYLVGREQLLALREDWREAMGGRFSLRAFHDRLLAEGSIPVSLVRRRMRAAAVRGGRRWTAPGRRAGARPGG